MLILSKKMKEVRKRRKKSRSDYSFKQVRGGLRPPRFKIISYYINYFYDMILV
jgi:hypothetical protein